MSVRKVAMNVGVIILSLGSVVFDGCRRDASTPVQKATTSKLKEFLGRTDLLLKIQRLHADTFVIPDEHKDTSTGSIKSRWVPGQITILPVTVEEVHKEGSEIRGANFTIQDDYYVISGYGSPTEGKHSKGSASLDLDELTDMQSAISFMQETARQWRVKNPTDDTTVRFISKDGLKLELEQDDDTRKIVFALSADGTAVTFGDEQLAALAGKISSSIDELKKR